MKMILGGMFEKDGQSVTSVSMGRGTLLSWNMWVFKISSGKFW